MPTSTAPYVVEPSAWEALRQALAARDRLSKWWKRFGRRLLWVAL